MLLCVAPSAHPSHSSPVPIPWLIMCTCRHAHLTPTSDPSPSHSCCKHMCPRCPLVSVSVTPHLVPHLLLNVYMHQYMYACPLHSPFLPCHLAYLHINMCTPVCPFLHVIHLSSGPTPSLGCVQASIHVCMTTWFPMSAPPHSQLPAKMCTLVCLCACPCNPSPGATSWLDCVYASMHVHQTPHDCSTPFV